MYNNFGNTLKFRLGLNRVLYKPSLEGLEIWLNKKNEK